MTGNGFMFLSGSDVSDAPFLVIQTWKFDMSNGIGLLC